jgi:hypothetical protein
MLAIWYFIFPGKNGPGKTVTNTTSVVWLLTFYFGSMNISFFFFLAGSNILLCQHRLSGLVSKGWAPRTKRPHLIYLCKQVTEAKSNVQPTYVCMWLHWLFHFPSAMWPSCFNSLSFISLLCHPFSLFYQKIVCLFVFWPSSLLH